MYLLSRHSLVFINYSSLSHSLSPPSPFLSFSLSPLFLPLPLLHSLVSDLWLLLHSWHSNGLIIQWLILNTIHSHIYLLRKYWRLIQPFWMCTVIIVLETSLRTLISLKGNYENYSTLNNWYIHHYKYNMYMYMYNNDIIYYTLLYMYMNMYNI